MTHAIAIDWDSHEVRYVSANISGKRLTQVIAGNVDLPPDAEGEGPPDIGSLLATVVDKKQLKSARLLVSVPRGHVELLQLTLPPAKDEELPPLVANEAQRQTSTGPDDAVVDFLPLDRAGDGPRSVSAALLAAPYVVEMESQLAGTRNKPHSLLLRRPALVSLASRVAELEGVTTLLVSRTRSEVELSVVVEGRDVFSRYFRLPEGNTDGLTDRLMAEITRTLTAAPQELIGPHGVEQVYIFGPPGEYDELLELLRGELEVQAEAVDAFAELDVAPGDIPADSSKYASLLAMLMDEAHGSHAIDFLNPRRPPRQNNRWKVVAIGGGLAAAAALALGLHSWMTISQIKAENLELYAEVKTLDQSVKKAQAIGKRVEAIAAWRTREVNWLDELRDLSIRAPSQRDVVVGRMSMRPGQSTVGRIDLQGVMRDSNVLVKLETGIRDEYRTVRSRQIRERLSEEDFTWLFETSVTVARRKREAYVSHLPNPPATESSAVSDGADEAVVPVSTTRETSQEEAP